MHAFGRLAAEPLHLHPALQTSAYVITPVLSCNRTVAMNQSYELLQTNDPCRHACCINMQLATGLRAKCVAECIS